MDKQKLFKTKNYQSLHLTPVAGVEIEKFYESTLNFLKIRHQKIALMEHWPEKLVEIISEKIATFPKTTMLFSQTAFKLSALPAGAGLKQSLASAGESALSAFGVTN